MLEEANLAYGEILEPPFAPEIYGAQDGDPDVQVLGNVLTRENRVICFPNTFQTRLDSMELVDKTRSGHCKILELHLIDPNRRCMSTAMVPCQRRDWWAQELRQTVPALRNLPFELFDLVVEMVDGFPISLEDGEQMRKEFRAEREEFQRKHTEAMLSYLTFDFEPDD